MRAGKLDRSIVIQAYARTGTTPAGAPVMSWSDFATVRAQIVQASTEEFQRDYGEGGNTAIIFRLRWLDGVTVAHRVTYDGKILNIREMTEIGRRRGLELRCEEVRS
uniref:phage head closure protein n=1 Tax=Stappia sp. TaxID=1870903 RepID=UPI003BABB206